MSRIAIALLVALASVLPAGAASASPERDRWRRPLPGAVVGSFSFDPSAPYERGRRRGIDLAGDAGAPVVAACAGEVLHAGRVPGWRAGVTLRCGRLIATELGLGSLAVRHGRLVAAGMPVGRLGAGGLLRLGARRVGQAQGYVDPERLLRPDRPWAPAPVGPVGTRRGAPRVAVLRRRVVPRGSAAPVAAAAPRAAWAGLALLLTGASGGSVVATRGRRRSRPGVEAAAAGR